MTKLVVAKPLRHIYLYDKLSSTFGICELSTEMLLNTLKRFVSRRGLCKHIFSDNTTNFTGANNKLLRNKPPNRTWHFLKLFT